MKNFTKNLLRTSYIVPLSFILSLLLASCGGGADANYDQQNIQKVTTNLRSFLKEGASFDKVDKALKKAGFVEQTSDNDNDGTPAAAPAARTPQKTTTTAKYFYNAPEDFKGIYAYVGDDDPKKIVGFNRIVASNRIYAEVYIEFDNESRLEHFDIEVVMNKELVPDHSLFITLENALYNELDLVPNSFAGTLCYLYWDILQQNTQKFSDREKFFSTLTNQQSVCAVEKYSIVLRDMEFGAYLSWNNRSDEVFNTEHGKLGYKPYAFGYISFSND